MVVGHVVELVHYAAVSVMNSIVITDWLKLLVKMETRLPVVVNPVVTLIKQHQRLHVAPGTGKRIMKPSKLIEFEKLQGDDLYSFIEQHNPSLVERKSHHPEMIKKYGENYWSFLLDNGIGICISATKEEAIEKFNAGYKKP